MRPWTRILLIVSLLLVPATVDAQQAVERNVVYSMYSGAALLMDVYRPAQSNRAAVVMINGSGWYRPMRQDAPPLKDEIAPLAQRFAAAGFTAFAVNHRASPVFRYPAALEDVQRAVRFIRAHAVEYAIDPARVGAWGASSGGHLALLLGTLDGRGESTDADPVNRESAKVQAVVGAASATDLPTMGTPVGLSATVTFMGFFMPNPSDWPPGFWSADASEVQAYRAASPTTHATADDAPTLLLHGDADDIVPIQQSELMEAKLKAAGVPVRLVRVAGGRHAPAFGLKPGAPGFVDGPAEAIRFFEQQLVTGRAGRR
jgi:acetyl esterase/lipase